jgi:NAD(P)-dependent dehydrogenase (short-subunit alcohol dehydrogenase family)
VSTIVDVSKEDDVVAAVTLATQRFGSIDILVNNAGIFPFVPLASMKESDFMRVIDVNLRGVFLMTKHVSEVMKQR